MIKLPAQLCGGKKDSLECLRRKAVKHLEETIDQWVKNGILRPGQDHVTQRPGSSIVLAREFEISKGEYQREFFCQNWKFPNGKYQVVLGASNASKSNETSCYIDLVPHADTADVTSM